LESWVVVQFGGARLGEPLVGRTFRFSAREDARPTHRLAKLCHHRAMNAGPVAAPAKARTG
jgi:hypothetical protein